MADDNDHKLNDLEDEDFSSGFADDDFSSQDLFGEDIQSDDYRVKAEDDHNLVSETDNGFEFSTSNPAQGARKYFEKSYKNFNRDDLKRLVIPAAIGMAILVIIIYGAIRILGGPAKPTSNKSTTTPPIKISPLIATTTSPPQQSSSKTSQAIELPPLTASKPVTQPPTELTKIQEVIGTLQTDMQTAFEKSDNNFDKMQADVTDLQSQAIQNAQEIKALAIQLTTISNKVDEASAILEQLINSIKQVSEPNPRSSTAHYQQAEGPPEQSPPAYYVQAIIPGRAWLKDASGKILSVGIGDQVPGFGTVTQINPRVGNLQTSSGVTIEYGISQY